MICDCLLSLGLAYLAHSCMSWASPDWASILQHNSITGCRCRWRSWSWSDWEKPSQLLAKTSIQKDTEARLTTELIQHQLYNNNQLLNIQYKGMHWSGTNHDYLRAGWAILLRGLPLVPMKEAGRGKELRPLEDEVLGLLSLMLEREFRLTDEGMVVGPSMVGLT